ncbi:MAG: lytic murein transglycosylase, partial [Acidisphaera sp.]|nr:lytic murein transglycosylase [Acidisphaera sp.]
MLTRRVLLAAPSLALPTSAWAYAGDFDTFLGGLRAEGLRSGVSAATLDRALAGLRPNEKVLELDRRQPEFTLTWERYRETRLTDQRIAQGRALAAQNRRLLAAVRSAYGVDAGVIMGIWGLESNYGGFTGGFNVIEALATLAWDGRRAGFFRPELMSAL